MDQEKIMQKESKKFRLINLRISQELSDWLKEKKYSPTGIFREACKELGWDKQ